MLKMKQRELQVCIDT